MKQESRIYYARRAAEEMERAMAADHPDAADTHRQLQRHYLERASVGERSIESSSDSSAESV